MSTRIGEHLEVRQSHGGTVELVITSGEHSAGVRLHAHEAHKLALELLSASLATLPALVPPTMYDLLFTLDARATSNLRDAHALLATVHEESVAAPARRALELARKRRKGDA